MRAGALRHIIDIQGASSSSVSDYNEPIETWANILTGIYAEMTATRGKEHFNAETGQRYSETVYLFRVRYDEIQGQITEKMRVVFEGQVYDIRSIRPDRTVTMGDAIIETTLQNGTV